MGASLLKVTKYKVNINSLLLTPAGFFILSVFTMNALDALVNIGYSEKEARKILPSLFLYLFRAFNQSELYARAEAINPRVNLFRLMPKIPLMGEITLHDKICIFALFQNEDPGIKPNEYIKSVVKDPEVRAHLSGFSEYPAYTVKQAGSLECRALLNKEIETYIGKFIFRKMSFIMNNYGIAKTDLVEQLQERAIHNLRMNYPNWNSSGEMLAMAKSAIANAGQNMLKFYSATKRARVDRDNKGVEYSLDQMQELAGDAPEYQAMVFSESLERGTSVMEARLSVDSLIGSLNKTPGKKLLIELLSGKFDSDFSDHLGVDSSVYAESVEFDVLLNSVCKYMRIPTEHGQQFIRTLSKQKGA